MGDHKGCLRVYCNLRWVGIRCLIRSEEKSRSVLSLYFVNRLFLQCKTRVSMPMNFVNMREREIHGINDILIIPFNFDRNLN